MSIPSGLYLVSDETDDAAQPVFAEILSKPKKRAKQWETLTTVGAVGRPCYVSESKADFDGWRKMRVEQLIEKYSESD